MIVGLIFSTVFFSFQETILDLSHVTHAFIPLRYILNGLVKIYETTSKGCSEINVDSFQFNIGNGLLYFDVSNFLTF